MLLTNGFLYAIIYSRNKKGEYKMYSNHFKYDRRVRQQAIRRCGGIGKVINEFNVMYEGKPQIHRVTDNAMILISPKDQPDFVITIIIARKNQVLRYYDGTPETLPPDVLKILNTRNKKKKGKELGNKCSLFL